VREGDALSLGLKSKKEVAEAMVCVCVALFQKDCLGMCVFVGGKTGLRLGVIRVAQEYRVVIRYRCCCTRRTPVAMRGALNLAARIMSCEIRTNGPDINVQPPANQSVLGVSCFWAKSLFLSLPNPLARARLDDSMPRPRRTNCGATAQAGRQAMMLFGLLSGANAGLGCAAV
jgi:hypothetical protein